MGNLFAECRRCSIEQCELCAEVLPRRPRDPQQASGMGAPSSSTGPRHSPNGRWREEADRNAGTAQDFNHRMHQEYQPSNMSEAEAMRLALQMSAAGLGQRSPGVGEDINGSGGLQRLVEDGGDPALLTAAIMASHQHHPGALRQPPRQPTEEEALAQAIRATKNEEEQRNRARLREEQQSEYAESELIDKAKQEERLRREREEEEKRKAEEDEKLKAELEEKTRRDRIATLIEEARARLREEPPKEEKSRVTVKVNTPQGRALKRTFRCEDRVSQIYDYVVAEGGEEFAFGRFRLLQGMPRTLYEEKDVTLQTAGLQGQCALLVQVIESDDEEEIDSGDRKPDQACSSTALPTPEQEITGSTALPTPEQEVGSGGGDRDQACSSTALASPEQEKLHSVASPTPEQEVDVTKADDLPETQALQETPVADIQEAPQPPEIPVVETPDPVHSSQQPPAEPSGGE